MKIKVLFAALLVIFMLFPINASANATVNISDLDETFYVFTNVTDSEKAAEIIGEDKEQLEKYCSSNGIIYLAVNEDNSKQIRISRLKSSFSEKLGNISFLTDEEIKEIFKETVDTPDYSITEKNSQKFILCAENYSDSGGEYNYTQYITVANDSLYTLSFYTSDGADTDYIEEVFGGYECDSFLNYNAKANNGYTVLAVAVIIALLALWIVYTIIRDLAASKKTKD